MDIEIKYLEFCVNQWEWIADELTSYVRNNECSKSISFLKNYYVNNISDLRHTDYKMFENINENHNCAMCALYQEYENDTIDNNCDRCRLLPLWNTHRKSIFRSITYAACEYSSSPYEKARRILNEYPCEYYDAVFFALLIAEEARNVMGKLIEEKENGHN
jgi:hypothetical protein